MTRILGLFGLKTITGEPLKDGSACLIEDNKISIAIAEERLNRIKHSGGFKKSVEYCLSNRNLQPKDIDLVVISNCSNTPLQKIDLSKYGFSTEKIVTVNSHHLSHAYSAFFCSPFKKSLIMVSDNEGNIIGKPNNYRQDWNNALERNSYFLGNKNTIQFLERDFERLNEPGFGEIYHYFTEYLGFKSYTSAGKTMGLAPYGKKETYNGLSLFEIKKGKLSCQIKNNRKKKFDLLQETAKKQGYRFPNPRKSTEPISQKHADMAFLVQDQLEKNMIKKINFLSNKHNQKNLCLAGGVSYNCVANMKLLEKTPITELFIQPAAGDPGQSIGNALYGLHHECDSKKRILFENVYLGKTYSDKEIQNALAENPFVAYHKEPNIEKKVAELLSKNFTIGWFQGKSEFGPRALGNRSVLAHPGFKENKNRINNLKGREEFRPLAPSILEEKASEYFEMMGDCRFMSISVHATKKAKKLAPAVVHVDGTSRIQTVNSKMNPRFYRTIKEFERLSNLPLVLNTSFNYASYPIVETPTDGVADFLKMKLDYLALENYLVKKL